MEKYYCEICPYNLLNEWRPFNLVFQPPLPLKPPSDFSAPPIKWLLLNSIECNKYSFRYHIHSNYYSDSYACLHSFLFLQLIHFSLYFCIYWCRYFHNLDKRDQVYASCDIKMKWHIIISVKNWIVFFFNQKYILLLNHNFKEES